MKTFVEKLKFYTSNPSILWRGECRYEGFDRERAQYARDHPWVLNYGFGHKELLEYQDKFDNLAL